MGNGIIQIHLFQKTEYIRGDVLPFFEYVDFDKELLLEKRYLEALHPLLEELFPNDGVPDSSFNYHVLNEENLDALISGINAVLIEQSRELSEYFYERFSKKANNLLAFLEEQATDFDFDGDEVLTISWGQ